MSESLVGFTVAATRQNAVRVLKARAAAGAGAAPSVAGGLNPPASTVWASVIFAWGSASDARLSHDWGGVALRSRPTSATMMTARRVAITRCFIPLPYG